MVSAEQRWNESRREHNRALNAYHRALQARNTAMLVSPWSPPNARRIQLQQRAQANFNRARTNFMNAAAKTTNAYRNLRRKYHLPNHPNIQTLNAMLMNLVRYEKANARQRGKARALTSVLPPNLAKRIARLT